MPSLAANGPAPSPARPRPIAQALRRESLDLPPTGGAAALGPHTPIKLVNWAGLR